MRNFPPALPHLNTFLQTKNFTSMNDEDKNCDSQQTNINHPLATKGRSTNELSIKEKKNHSSSKKTWKPNTEFSNNSFCLQDI